MPTLLQPPPTTAEGRAASKIAALEQRVAALERSGTAIPVLTSPPTTPARPGSLCTNSFDAKFYLYVNGVWRYANML